MEEGCDVTAALPPLGGYSRSKWVAERLVFDAGRRGLPASVYRLGEVMPAEDNGLPNPRALTHLLLTAFHGLGLRPDVPMRTDYSPVDQVADRLVAGLGEPAAGRILHVFHGGSVSLPDLAPELPAVSEERFRAALAAHGREFDVLLALPAGLERVLTDNPALFDRGRRRRRSTSGTAWPTGRSAPRSPPTTGGSTARGPRGAPREDDEPAMRYRTMGRLGWPVSEVGYGMWGIGGGPGGFTGWDYGVAPDCLDLAVELGLHLLRHRVGLRARSQRAAARPPAARPRRPAALRRDEGAADEPRVAAAPRRPAGATCSRPRTCGSTSRRAWRTLAWTASICCSSTSGRTAGPARSPWQEAVSALKDEGLIEAFGLSVNRWEPANCLRAVDTGLVDVVQVIYNIFDQAPEDELFARAERDGIGIIARVPFDEGGLTGALTRQTQFPEEDWRAVYFGPENLGPTVERAEKLLPLVPEGSTLPELALRFILEHPAVSTVIPGMRKPGARARQPGCVRRRAAGAGPGRGAARAPLGPRADGVVDVTGPPVIAMWAHPRAVSTAFLRMMIERGDTTVVHEPLVTLADYGKRGDRQ